MAHSLKGKVVLVTGAASGIGAAVVKQLVTEDVKHVVMLNQSEEDGVALQIELNLKYKENKVTFITCDVTNEERLIESFKIAKNEFGAIDVVVNSAGIFDDSEESYVKEITVNVVALITSSLQAWKIMHKEKGGSGGTIINFSSIAAITKFVNIPIYSATKSAVLKFSTTLGDLIHYSKSGVRVLCMCFGATKTPILRNINKAFDESIQKKSMEELSQLEAQSAEAAATAVLDVYKSADSGSVWISTSGQPAIDVTKIHNENIELYNEYIY